MNEKQIRQWSETRKKGRRRFILVNGVLGWGVMTGVLWSLFMAMTQGWEKLPAYLAFGLIGFPLGGLAFGAIVWSMSEKKYAAVKAEETQSTEADLQR